MSSQTFGNGVEYFFGLVTELKEGFLIIPSNFHNFLAVLRYNCFVLSFNKDITFKIVSLAK